MKSPTQVFALVLLAVACVLLVLQRLFSSTTPIWVDALVLGASALCLVGALGLSQHPNRDEKTESNAESPDGKE